MTAIEQIIAIAEQLGWQVKTDTDKPNLVVFDFQQYTPHGQDFSFSVEMKGNDTDSLLQEVETYYEDFDPDYEAYLLSLIHISEPTRLGMISYAVFCLKKKKNSR